MKITALTASLSESSTSHRLAQRILDAAAELATETAPETAAADPQAPALIETEVINPVSYTHLTLPTKA